MACFPLYSKSGDSGRGFSLQAGKMLLFSFSFLVGLCSCVYVQLCLLVCVVVYGLCGGVCFAWWCVFYVVVVVYVLFDRVLLRSPGWL